MDYTEYHKKIIKVLQNRNANSVVIFIVLKMTENWNDTHVKYILEFMSREDVDIRDIVDKCVELDGKYPLKAIKSQTPGDEEALTYRKPFLFLFYNGGMAGLMKFQIGSKQADYFSFDLWDFNVCKLPKDINDDKELEQCADDWVYPNEWTVKNYKELRQIDYSKYKAVIVWNDMTPNSLMFLYTICKFADADNLYENNVSNFNMCPIITLNEPDRDYDGILDNLRLITPDVKKNFSGMYDKFAGQEVSAKIAKGYDIYRVDDSVIEERILAHCNDKYQTAIHVATEAQFEKDPNSQEFISYHYFTMKIFDLVIDGKFDVKQNDHIIHYEDDDDPYIYNGVDISYDTYYSIKLKDNK